MMWIWLKTSLRKGRWESAAVDMGAARDWQDNLRVTLPRTRFIMGFCMCLGGGTVDFSSELVMPAGCA